MTIKDSEMVARDDVAVLIPPADKGSAMDFPTEDASDDFEVEVRCSMREKRFRVRVGAGIDALAACWER